MMHNNFVYKKNIEKKCCNNAPLGSLGKYICKNCGAINCFLHVTLWTDGMYHCYYCFGITEVMSEAKEFVIREKISDKRSNCKRILLIIDGLYIAGAQRHCLELIRVFYQFGYLTTVLALEGGGQWIDKFINIAEKVILVNKDSVNLFEIANYLDTYNYQFATAHLKIAIEWCSIEIPTWVRKYAHLHSEPSEHEAIDKEWFCKYTKSFKGVFFPSKNTLEVYKSFINGRSSLVYNNKLAVLPNNVPQEFIRNKISNNDKKKHLGIISRIDNDKFSISLFINTIKCLDNIYPEYQVKIAGNGDIMEELVIAIKKNGLEDKINILGFVQDIIRIYEWSDVVFLPSKREGMPYVLLECLAAKNFLVAPRIGIFSEYIDPRIMVFDQNNPKKAAELIKNAFLNKPNNSNSQKNNYDGESFCIKYYWKELVKKAYELN